MPFRSLTFYNFRNILLLFDFAFCFSLDTFLRFRFLLSFFKRNFFSFVMKVVYILALLCLITISNGAGIRRPVSGKGAPILSLSFPASERLLNRARSGEAGNANDYMDEVLALVREEIVFLGYDRIQLPDGDFSFTWDAYPGVNGGVFLHDGLATGMETIHRVGDATLSNTETVIFFESDCGINNAAFGYAISILFMDIGPTASMTGTADYINFYFHATVDILSGIVVVDVFDLKKIGHISTDIKGLGIFNWLAEIIVDFTLNLLKPFFKELIEGPITNLINVVLQNYSASIQRSVSRKDTPVLSLNFPATGKLLARARSGEMGNANDYMDEVLALVREQIVIQGYDRIQLPGGDFSFTWDAYPGVTGGVYLHDGLATGMETIHRVGDATLSNSETVIFFESDCGINNAAFGYAISILFLDIGPTASMTGTADYINFYFHSTIDILSGIVVVDVFDLKQMGHISTEITGLGIFNWLAEIIVDFTLNLLAPFFKELLEGPITNLINTVLQHYVDSLMNPTTTMASRII
uniref:Soldier-specific protein-1 n=1 Tax=Daphnia galeata TaxID=27404 RepID=A0A8J2WHH6_9CRUS|nr:unnamed protein product [Daphnia galeata]